MYFSDFPEDKPPYPHIKVHGLLFGKFTQIEAHGLIKTRPYSSFGRNNFIDWSSEGRSFVMRSLNPCPENFSQNIIDWSKLPIGKYQSFFSASKHIYIPFLPPFSFLPSFFPSFLLSFPPLFFPSFLPFFFSSFLLMKNVSFFPAPDLNLYFCDFKCNLLPNMTLNANAKEIVTLNTVYFFLFSDKVLFFPFFREIPIFFSIFWPFCL